MYCQTCGATIPEDSTFCPSCGRRVDFAAPLQSGEEPVKYTGFIERFLAYILDTLVLAVLVIALVMALFIVFETFIGFPQAGAIPSVEEVRLFSFIATTIVSYLYFAYQESSPRQATIGKRALGIAVTDLEGERITFGRATIRFIGKSLSWIFFPVFFAIAVTEKKQGLHDMAAGTLVVKKKV